MEKPAPVVITVYKDKKFDFIIKFSSFTFYKRSCKVEKWIKRTWKSRCWINNYETSRTIAKEKMKDLNDGYQRSY